MTTATVSASSGESIFRRLKADFPKSGIAMIGLIALLFVIVLAVFAPLISPQNPYDLMQINVMDNRLPPGATSMEGHTYLLGTDNQGRDVLSAIFYGLRISLGVAVGYAFVALILGTALGLIAAYASGRVDTLIMRVVDLQLSFPAILVGLMILAFMGRGVVNVVIALIIVEWAYYARTVRASALVEIRREYIDAATVLRIPKLRILFLHLLPNCLPPIIVIGTIQMARAITLEATLSFLGLGVPITEPSLGLLIANGYEFLLSGTYWISIFPGIALVITVMSFNLVGDRLRDILNPRGHA